MMEVVSRRMVRYPTPDVARFFVMLAVLGVAGVVTLSAQTKRIFTNPRPEPHFKTLFPNAAGFSAFGGTPLHWKA